MKEGDGRKAARTLMNRRQLIGRCLPHTADLYCLDMTEIELVQPHIAKWRQAL